MNDATFGSSTRAVGSVRAAACSNVALHATLEAKSRCEYHGRNGAKLTPVCNPAAFDRCAAQVTCRTWIVVVCDLRQVQNRMLVAMPSASFVAECKLLCSQWPRHTRRLCHAAVLWAWYVCCCCKTCPADGNVTGEEVKLATQCLYLLLMLCRLCSLKEYN